MTNEIYVTILKHVVAYLFMELVISKIIVNALWISA
jgi:hypothetical protein